MEGLEVKYIPQKERDKIPDADFAGPGRTFPVRNQADLDHAARLIGHAEDPEAVKSKLIEIAKRKGLTLPKSWQNTDHDKMVKPKLTREKLYKSLHLSEVKTVDEEAGTFEGYLAYFDNEDKSEDVIERGAFKKTLQESKSWATSHEKDFILPILWQHNRDIPLGGFMDAYEDNKGLYVKGYLDVTTNEAGFPNNPEATKAYSGLKIGYIDEMSIGYYVIKREFKGGVRYLKELSVFEGSLVTTNLACNPEALVTGVKIEMEKKQLIDFSTRLTVARAMHREQKDFNSHLADSEAQDCLEDWYDLQSCLRQTTIDLFTMGDQPIADAEAAIDQFKEAYLAYVARCQAANLSEYLANQENYPYGYLCYMTRSERGSEQKDGRALSKKNTDTIKTAVDGIHEKMAGIKEHTQTLADLLDEYEISNDNNEKTRPAEPVQQTTQEQAKEPVQATPQQVEVKAEPTQQAQPDPKVTQLLSDMRSFLTAHKAA